MFCVKMIIKLKGAKEGALRESVEGEGKEV